MAIVAFDIGGTAVKYGLWHEDSLCLTNSFPTPKNWSKMKQELIMVVENFKKMTQIAGIAISAPGAVNTETGIIGGISAVPYIHHFPLVSELEKLFDLPVAIENDANCAALAEVWRGAAKDVEHALFLIIGSGIGGALVVNRTLVKGPQLFGGEFGYMLMDDHQTFSQLASPVVVAREFGKKHLNEQQLSGKELFMMAEEGNQEALLDIDQMYEALARGILNLAVSFNPDKVLIGGGLSSRTDLLPTLNKKVNRMISQVKADELVISLEVCKFNNQANLIGAVANFMDMT